ncbi:MAG: HAMP domain-containing histidine kinase [Opitutae bacterium]|nr:HAMP domain-containing histidine kinase [Opitutae bacterium]
MPPDSATASSTLKPAAGSGRFSALQGAASIAPERLRELQRLVAQGELAASAVHEISNLITLVLLNAGLLRQKHGQEPEIARYVDPMLHACDAASSLCGQLRNLSRPPEAQPREFDLVARVQDTLRLLQQVLARELVCALPSLPLPVFADPAHIDQILINLVLNARDATTEDGRIVVRVGAVGEAAPHRQPRFLEVEDNGRGMDANTQRQLFRLFFTTKPAGRGSGIGLATVQYLTEQSRGTIELDSAVGRGTRLRIVFPPPEVPHAAPT